MRISASLAGLLFATVFFAASTQSVHAQSQNDQQTNAQSAPTSVVEDKKVQVQPGDYLEKIAEENATTYPRLYDANVNIQDPDIIYPGDTLRIPKPDEQLASRAVPQDAPPVVAQALAAVVPKAAAKPRATPAAAPVAAISDGSVWDSLARCESGGNWAINTGNGYYGGLQFTLSTWQGVGGSGYPHQASREEQIARGKILQARSGWGQWPACTAKLGLR